MHRLRANYAQEKYQVFLSDCITDQEARRRVFELLGHVCINVTYEHVPRAKIVPVTLEIIFTERTEKIIDS